MDKQDLPKRYNELFKNDEIKAKAFDEIAARYYNHNFGQMSKSDFETLLFHLYLERVLCNDKKNNVNTDFNSYSDFTLSEELGITQSRVANLKVKKQLQYRREYDWRKAFAEVAKSAYYDDKKIKIMIPDINLYYEIKNAIEKNGGYVEVSLTSKLLQVSPMFFLDLIVAIADKEVQKVIIDKLKEKIEQDDKSIKYVERVPFGKQLMRFGKNAIPEILNELSKCLNGSPFGYILAIVSGLISASSKK